MPGADTFLSDTTQAKPGGTGRLVVISNRVAIPKAGEPPAGGLAVGLSAALTGRGGEWIGWSGKTAKSRDGIQERKVDGVTYALFDLTRKDVSDYYNGFSNQVLWPAFHFRVDRMAFNRRYLRGYMNVNDHLAKLIRPRLGDQDLVWVHDYHLIPLGRCLRERGATMPLGFFLHIPFPPTEILRTIPGHQYVFECLMYYDLVGFQTPSNAHAFIEYAKTVLGAEKLGKGTLKWRERIVQVRSLPIGIDVENMERFSVEGAKHKQVQRVRDSVVDSELIIGVDRLDYSKGIPERFRAFDLFLRNYLGKEPRATFLQISPPSRTDVEEYRIEREQVTAMAGDINARHGAPDFTPIRHVFKSFSRKHLAALYRISRVGLVTPLRDGMNLVAKEYVAAQDPMDPGVLLLSHFAGAAETNMHGAVKVNPYDLEETAELIYKALVMPRSERLERWSQMIKEIRTNDASAWCGDYLDALVDAHKAARAS